MYLKSLFLKKNSNKPFLFILHHSYTGDNVGYRICLSQKYYLLPSFLEDRIHIPKHD